VNKVIAVQESPLLHEHKLETKKTYFENRIVTEVFCIYCNMLVINYVEYLADVDTALNFDRWLK